MPDQSPGSISEHKPHPQPEDIKRVAISGGTEISRRWSFKPEDLFIGIIGLILLLLELGSVIYVSLGSLGFLDLILIIFGPIMVYYSLAHRLNSTRFSVVMGEIIIRKGPLPWIGNRVISTADISKLFLKGVGRGSKKKAWYTYSVVANLRNGKETVLDTSEKEEQAAYLRQELERCLRMSPQLDPVDMDASAG